MNNINAFILAAGYGERLRPITDHIPKPLLPILGRPIIEIIIQKLLKSGINEIGVNTHHMHSMIAEWIEGSPFSSKIHIFHEHEILGTGGGLKNAYDFLKNGTFIVHNSDIITDIDIEKLIEVHRKEGNIATLAILSFGEFNNLKINKDRALTGLTTDKDPESFTFTGIAIYEPEFLDYISEDNSSVVNAWLVAIKDKKRIGTVDFTGSYWRDIGTPRSYVKTVFELLRLDGETVFFHPSLKAKNPPVFQGMVVVERDVNIGERVFLKDCLILPGVNIDNDTEVNSCILGQGYSIPIDMISIFPSPVINGGYLSGTGGSDRTYTRIKQEGKNVILMKCRDDDPDFERHIEYSRFFLKAGIPVPEVISTDRSKREAIFEDAGDITLYSYLKFQRDKEDIMDIYRKILDILVRIHSIPEELISNSNLFNDRVFDYTYFLWEGEYFLKWCVNKMINLDKEKQTKIMGEIEIIANRSANYHRTLIHRDFQSQNIMITEEGDIKIIDFQGARIGPPAYDTASLLWDPYYRLPSGIREQLIDYYVEKMKGSADWFDEDEFRESLIFMRIQRHMQALGAYGFLSISKGKRHFQKFIPEGISLLYEDLSILEKEFPVLNRIVDNLKITCNQVDM